MHHPLLVARLVVAEPAAGLLQRLAQAGHVAVPEDAEHAREERRLPPVTLDVLLRQELDRRLRDGQPPRRRHSAELTPYL